MGFAAGAHLIGTRSSAPYTITWAPAAAGNYSLTARAIDNTGEITVSPPVAVSVVANAAPTVSLAEPPGGGSYTSATFTANATDSDGTITKVEFYVHGVLAATDSEGPFTFTLTNVAPGGYTITAKAYDQFNAQTTSSPLSVNIVEVNAYFIHTDHLNTPRVITNSAGQIVWTWANDDPFGYNAPNENPSGLGNFTCNLRFPGQYFDKETNLHYNYQRDGYDPGIGRYTQSDPIGLSGGINTYLYALANPLSHSDPSGLVIPIIAACALNPACATTVMVGGAIALGGLFNRPLMNSGKGSGDNLIPFPGTRPQSTTNQDYCPPDDACKRSAEELLQEMNWIIQFEGENVNPRDGLQAVRVQQAKIEYNRRARNHNARCPNKVPEFLVRDPSR